jgi:hypothetical protein
MMPGSVDAPGSVAFFVMFRLIQHLVHRSVIELDGAKELVDLALLDAEELLGSSEGGKETREILESFLRDLDAGSNRDTRRED